MMDDYDLEKREVVKFFYDATAGYRLVRNIYRLTLAAAMLLVWLAFHLLVGAYNNAAWIVGLGSRGAISNAMSQNWDSDGEGVAVDFSKAGADRPFELGPEDYVSELEPCPLAGDGRSMAEEPATWAADAEDGVILRKAARLNKDMADAKAMVATLRYLIAKALFLRDNPGFDAERFHANMDRFLADPCDAKNANPFVRDTPEWVQFDRAYRDIGLPNAPKIRIRYADGKADLADITLDPRAHLAFHANLYSDLFAYTPRITAGQREAEVALKATATYAFWKDAEAANGFSLTREDFDRDIVYARYIRCKTASLPHLGWEDGTDPASPCVAPK